MSKQRAAPAADELRVARLELEVLRLERALKESAAELAAFRAAPLPKPAEPMERLYGDDGESRGLHVSPWVESRSHNLSRN